MVPRDKHRTASLANRRAPAAGKRTNSLDSNSLDSNSLVSNSLVSNSLDSNSLDSNSLVSNRESRRREVVASRDPEQQVQVTAGDLVRADSPGACRRSPVKRRDRRAGRLSGAQVQDAATPPP